MADDKHTEKNWAEELVADDPAAFADFAKFIRTETDDPDDNDDPIEWTFGSKELQKCRIYVMALREGGGRITTDGLFNFCQMMASQAVREAVEKYRAGIGIGITEKGGGQPCFSVDSGADFVYGETPILLPIADELFSGDEAFAQKIYDEIGRLQRQHD